MLLNTYYANEEGKLDKKLSLYQADPKFYIKMPNGENAPVFDYKNFPFEIFKDCPVHSKRGKTLDRVSYLDLVSSFDIETSTILTAEEPFAIM